MKSLSKSLALLLISFFSVPAFAADASHWGYEDSDTTVGPQNWGGSCNSGKEQSPIDIHSDWVVPATKHLTDVVFDYKSSHLKMTNNGHSVSFDYDPGSSVKIAGQNYQLKEFHFHAPSEHSIDGKFYPLEIHLVHTDAQGNPKIVFAVFVAEGVRNVALGKAFSSLPKKAGDVTESSKNTGDTMINAKGILPKKKGFYHYKGSLTTPPCDEGLDWYVFKTPITMDAAQINAFTSIPGMGKTQRPVQSLGSRQVDSQ